MGLLLFIAIPAVELYLLINVGSAIGPAAVVALILLTGTVGWTLVKHQGMATLRRIQEELSQGRIPAREMVSGLCLLASGLLLITPGFLTDITGFLLLVPFIRGLVVTHLMSRYKGRIIDVQARDYPDHGQE